MGVSWITVFVAGVPALYIVTQWQQNASRQSISYKTRSNQGTTEGRFTIFAKRCEKLLGPLCDIQIITGSGIIIAGWAQIKSIDYYHEELVIAYWWLTLNSFWTCRSSYFDPDPTEDKIRIFVQQVTILCSCVLGLSFQGYTLLREDTWDDDGGPCCRFLDGSNAIPWIAGLSLFCLALISVMFKRTRFLNRWHLGSIEFVDTKISQWHEKTIRQWSECVSGSCTLKRLSLSLQMVLSSVCRIVWSGLVLWLAVWSYGDSYWPAE